MESTPVDGTNAKPPLSCYYAWFNPARIHPQVESLVYWRDVKKSGAVFGVLMVTLISLKCYSLISVVSYLCLFTLAGTISFRIYKNIMQAVQKTSDGHPFKEYLEMDLTLPEDKVRELSTTVLTHFNSTVSELRRLFLVEDLVDSLKFGLHLWILTCIGSWFNGLTLVMIGVVLLFAMPKVYENNKDVIDGYYSIAMEKVSAISVKLKSAVPMGKKEEKPKDQ